MKSATMPALRVAPETRREAESVLEEGESLSAFLEQSLIRNIRFRQEQKAFVAKGLASKVGSEQSGVYFSTAESLAALDDIIEQYRPAK